MFLKSIELKNFRNYHHLCLTFHNGINIIYGNNAQGKTNLLESIYVLALTKSHRSFIDHNLIRNNEECSKITGIMEEDNFENKLEIILSQKKKQFFLDDDCVKKVSDYVSNLNIIIFYPEDLELIKGSPALRRRYINMELSQLYGSYLNVVNDYNRLLKMRNDYLKKVQKKGSMDINYFQIITNYLIDKAVFLYQYRFKFVEKLNSYVTNIYYDITGLSNFHLVYRNYFDFCKLDRDYMKEQLRLKFQTVHDQELRLGTTLVGPHRDDLEFYLGNQDLKIYGSQGQQRVAVLAMKLAEISIFEQYRGSMPILLLDDVFSELDDQKKNNLLKYIHQNVQTIITTTDLKNIDTNILKDSKIIKIDDGQVIEEKEVDVDGTK